MENCKAKSAIKVSVTVPVYNTERYLRKCLDSLSAQTLREMEFILVDDGSTDDSPAICEEYSRNDNRFRVIHQQNGGLAVARQTGLSAAYGEYVIVCDSDDWVEPNMYERLYAAAIEDNADIVMCGYWAEYEDGRSSRHNRRQKAYEGCEFVKETMLSSAHMSWTNLVRRSLFAKTGASYQPGINLGEDALILFKLLKGNPHIVHINDNLYHYRRLFGQDTYTNSVRMSNLMQMDYVYNWLKDNYDSELFADGIFAKAVNIAFTCFRVKDLDRDYLRKFLHSELPFGRIRFRRMNLKSLFVYTAKILPYPLMKHIFDKLYKHCYN